MTTHNIIHDLHWFSFEPVGPEIHCADIFIEVISLKRNIGPIHLYSMT